MSGDEMYVLVLADPTVYTTLTVDKAGVVALGGDEGLFLLNEERDIVAFVEFLEVEGTDSLRLSACNKGLNMDPAVLRQIFLETFMREANSLEEPEDETTCTGVGFFHKLLDEGYS